MAIIGFIGLGHMGQPMLQNLLKAGHTVYAYDIVPAAMEAAEKFGAKPVRDIASLAEQAEVIISSVQTGDQLKKICEGKDGIFSHAKPGALYIDCSSMDINLTRAMHAEAEKHHIAMIDAPVSGGVAGAKAATLTIMVGGTETNFQRAYPILETMGKNIIHAGPAGNGQAAKICNNLLLAISMVGVCEAFSLAKKLGLDQQKFFDISSQSSGQCWSMTKYCPVPDIVENVPSNNHYQPGFMAKMMLKDLRLAQQAAQLAEAVIPLGAVTAELYELYINEGNGEKDFSGIIHLLAGN